MRGRVRAAEAAANVTRGRREAEWAAMRNHTAQVTRNRSPSLPEPEPEPEPGPDPSLNRARSLARATALHRWSSS